MKNVVIGETYRMQFRKFYIAYQQMIQGTECRVVSEHKFINPLQDYCMVELLHPEHKDKSYSLLKFWRYAEHYEYDAYYNQGKLFHCEQNYSALRKVDG